MLAASPRFSWVLTGAFVLAMLCGFDLIAQGIEQHGWQLSQPLFGGLGLWALAGLIDWINSQHHKRHFDKFFTRRGTKS